MHSVNFLVLAEPVNVVGVKLLFHATCDLQRLGNSLKSVRGVVTTEFHEPILEFSIHVFNLKKCLGP